MTVEEQITEFLKAQKRQPVPSDASTEYSDPMLLDKLQAVLPLRTRRDYTTVARKTLSLNPEEVKTHE